jgi:hypothetical protein
MLASMNGKESVTKKLEIQLKKVENEFARLLESESKNSVTIIQLNGPKYSFFIYLSIHYNLIFKKKLNRNFMFSYQVQSNKTLNNLWLRQQLKY